MNQTEPSEPRQTVLALIFNESGQVLLLHKCAGNNWNFPGGRVGFPESRKAALVREVFEECGLNVTFPKKPRVGKWTHPVKGTTRVYYKCLIAGGEAQNREPALHDELRWVPPEEAAEMLDATTAPELRDILRNMPKSGIKDRQASPANP